jgi:hypothetical protein
MTGKEIEGGVKGDRARTLVWTTPIKELQLYDIMPLFVGGLQEKIDPLAFLAEQGLYEIIKGSSVKRLISSIRSFVFPLKDNLRTLDDEICVKTINMLN